MTEVTRIKNGSITLPKSLRDKWRGAEVLVMSSEDSVLVKKISRPSLSELAPKLRKFGKMISAKDIRDAVKWARNKTYHGREEKTVKTCLLFLCFAIMPSWPTELKLSPRNGNG